MLHTDKVIVVEGKYDAIKLANIIDGTILRTDGFGIFKDQEKQLLLRRLAEQRGLLVLTDSDSAGFLIRNFIKSAVPASCITNVYIPDIYGKERRKDRPSAEGKLGVEGIPDEVLIDCFRRAGVRESEVESSFAPRREITAADFYEAGLSGKPGSAERRQALQKALGLPERMTGKQLLSVINLFVDYDKFCELTGASDHFSMELPKQAARAIEKLEEAGFEAYAVGGCVRDTILGRTPNDWDITTSALPEQTEAVFADCRLIETGLQHGTVTVLMDGMPLEITTYRVDGTYADFRHPDDITFTRSLQEDLARRDFTMNALAFSPSRGLADAFGGLADLRACQIRCVGTPKKRFEEDALRILRALRFASVLRFSIEPQTEAAVHSSARLILHVSEERIEKELTQLLCGPGAAEVLERYPDVFSVFLPELADTVGFHQKNPHHLYDVYGHTVHAIAAAPADLEVRLSLLFHDIGKPKTFSLDEGGTGHFYGHAAVSAEMADAALRRLRFPTKIREQTVLLVKHHHDPLSEDPRHIRKMVGKFGAAFVEKLIEIERADAIGTGTVDPAEIAERFHSYQEALEWELARKNCFQVRDLAVSGRDLMQAGIPEGPEIGAALNQLLQMVQDETVENTREALLAALKGVKNNGNGSGNCTHQ